MAKGPVLFDLEEETKPRPDVAEAPPVIDILPSVPQGQVMQLAAKIAARKPSKLVRVFWWLATALIGAIASLAAVNFVTDLMARMPIVGLVLAAVMVVFLVVLALLCLRELAALSRLRRLDGIRHSAAIAANDNDLSAAQNVTARLTALYKGRDDTRWGRDRFAELQMDQLDASGLLGLAETEMLRPLDDAARQEIQAAARQVATATALVPMALVDVAIALTTNLRMIRRIAEIYGGRAGFFGGWRLTRAVLGHLVATGAVAIGDDMLEPILGGTILAKLSRRFGEGLVNGALTARVGVAAIEVCRPLPFTTQQRPKVAQIIKASLTGLFGKK